MVQDFGRGKKTVVFLFNIFTSIRKSVQYNRNLSFNLGIYN